MYVAMDKLRHPVFWRNGVAVNDEIFRRPTSRAVKRFAIHRYPRDVLRTPVQTFRDPLEILKDPRSMPESFQDWIALSELVVNHAPWLPAVSPDFSPN